MLKKKKTQKKVTFMSWQSDETPLDFSLIIDGLRNDHNNDQCEIVVLCKKKKSGLVGNIKYVFHMYKQMYNIATSKVVVLDSYVPVISILHHKNDLEVLQLWHALGAIKKFGHQAVGSEDGRSDNYAKWFKMHNNYSKIISSSSATTEIFSDAFGYDNEDFIECGLPRIDHLLDNSETLKKSILNEYKKLNNGKKNILYAPTFRRSGNYNIMTLIDAIDLNQYNLIVVCHPLAEVDISNEKVLYGKPGTAMDFLCMTDYLITDYSAIALEAAVLDIKTLYYLYDYDTYINSNGLNIDSLKEMPEISSKDIKDIVDLIDDDNYNKEIINVFKAKYLPEQLGMSTETIVNKIETWLHQMEKGDK